ncbi:Gln/Pro-rich protein [Pleurostoma richardsiae]|uniref:Gln/Pro-rich protein n=1 Tax=Pleurostoma richardsiae TaxID=41990 RepID=A0AA38RB20_9PEZI|nr:Gln/Pro-rich protein [Pleurostoma richardsiae]
MPQSPAPNLAPPPEGIYRSFDELLNAVQKVAKDQGYGVVKLRSSNYREGKPTRFDLVCDRGGVKYNSTAKKRNPTTRKVDCPWRGKAVCEVQLGNQWRFVVQEGRHNHEPRVPALPPGQENTPLGQSLRKLVDKIDRMGHDMAQGFTRVETRLEKLEKRLEYIEQHATGSANRVTMMGAPVNMVEGRLSNMEARMNAMESRQNGMEIPMDEVDSRLLAGTVI